MSDRGRRRHQRGPRRYVVNTGWKLRVVWPILDPLLSDAEAMAAAWWRLPAYAEAYQITLADQPHMRVERCTAEQKRKLRAARAVVCEAPAIPRTRYQTRRAA